MNNMSRKVYVLLAHPGNPNLNKIKVVKGVYESEEDARKVLRDLLETRENILFSQDMDDDKIHLTNIYYQIVESTLKTK